MTTGWQPAQAYPDPAIITLDPRFEPLRPPMNAAVERLYTGCRWSEGPVWIGDLRCLLWSDIPNNRILKWDEETGETTIFRKPFVTWDSHLLSQHCPMASANGSGREAANYPVASVNGLLSQEPFCNDLGF